MSDDTNGHIEISAAPEPVSDKPKNLWQKLCEVGLILGYIQKRGRHPTKHFAYMTSLDIRQAIREEIFSRNIWFDSGSKDSTHHFIEKPGKNGSYTVIITTQKQFYRFTNGDAPDEIIENEWFGYSEGGEAYSSYGCATGGQRHFLDSTFLLLSGEIDPEKFSAQMEVERQKIEEQEQSKKAKVNEKKSEAIMKVVSDTGKYPKPEELVEIDYKAQPKDESWRGIGLLAWPELEKRYPGKKVEDIQIKHLIHGQGFASKVYLRQEGFKSPACNQLADALANRLDWEVEAGNISRTPNPDGTFLYEVLPKHENPSSS